MKNQLMQSPFGPFLRAIKVRYIKIIMQLSLIKVFLYDYKKFKKYSGINGFNRKNSLKAWLLFDIHRLEKGLVLKNTRPKFGKSPILAILNNLEKYRNILGYGRNEPAFQNDEIVNYAISILKQYDCYHQSIGVLHYFNENKLFCEYISYENQKISGVKTIDIEELDFDNFETVVSTRFSCREFKKCPVANDDITKAVQLAISTPSVCNRQHWRVRFLQGKECKDVLELQNGNAPFRDEIENILVITSDLGNLLTPYERYQQYIDGGMFSMSILNALHHFKIGSCALNWASSLKQDIDIYNMKIIPRNEAVIMIVAIGYYEKTVNATCSTRLGIDSIMYN